MITRIFQIIGKKTLDFLQEFGQVVRLLVEMFKFFPQMIKRPKNLIEQMEHIGVNSLPLVFIIAIFTGAVSAWQAAYQLKGIAPLSILGTSTSRAIITELGPVLTAIVIAGRVGASIAAEIGSMKVTEQIDAMEVSSTNPMRFLVVTRVLAATLMIPLLILYADAFGLVGSWVGVNMKGSVTFVLFFSQAFSHIHFMDFLPAVIKSFFSL